MLERELVRKVAQNERRLDSLVMPELSPDLVSPLLALPMLRGAWVASVDSGGDWFDLSGLGKTLSYQGAPTVNYDGVVPYWDYAGAADYHNRGDEADLDILGNEGYVAAAAQGLTLGGWFWLDVTGALQYLMSKERGAAPITWSVYVNAANHPIFKIGYGANTDTVVADGTVSASRWYFIVGRFVNQADTTDIFVNNVLKSEGTTFAVAALNNNDNDFVIGGDSGGGNLLNGRAACCFLCAAALSDAIVRSLFAQTRAAFGV